MAGGREARSSSKWQHCPSSQLPMALSAATALSMQALPVVGGGQGSEGHGLQQRAVQVVALPTATATHGAPPLQQQHVMRKPAGHAAWALPPHSPRLRKPH
jgi:hypothetical protein